MNEPGSLAGDLLERSGSLELLSGLIAEISSGGAGRLIWVGGESGVGKTALLRSFCAHQQRPVRVLWGGCEPMRAPRPFGPLFDVAVAAGPRLGELLAAGPRPHEVGTGLLEELQRRHPTVLVLEDLQWADEATLDVLTMLATRIGATPALALATYRDDELGLAPELRRVIGELARRPSRLRLEPLSPAAVATLAAPHGLDPATLHARTGGNPFFVGEVLATGGTQMPETVRDAVLARAGRLSEPARELLDAIAIVPGQTEIWLLRELAGVRVERLEECIGAGIVAASATTVSFRHELARQAIDEAIPPHRRIELHRSALAALDARARPGDEARVAHHAEVAGDSDAVFRWAPKAAGRAARAGSHREAAEQYERALRFADELPLGERAALLERRSEECYLSAQIDEAIAAQEDALDCYRRLGDTLREGDALRVLSRTLFFVGRVTDGEAAARQAVALLEPLPAGHELAKAYCNLGQRAMVVERGDEAVAWSTRGIELAERLDDVDAYVHALTNIGASELQSGDDSGLEKLDRALVLAQQHDLEDHTGRILNARQMMIIRERKLAEAERHIAEGLPYCEERGLDTWRLYLLACRARVDLDRGRWEQAADGAALVLRDPHSADVARTWALIALGLVRTRRGDADAAAPLDEAGALARPTAELSRIGPAAAASAELAWLTGDQDGVASATADALALALDLSVPWAAGELAYWRWRAGVATELPEALIPEPYRRSIAGDWHGAAELWGAIGCPYEQALALADAGETAVARRGVEALQALGARPAAAIVSRRLRQRGVRGVPRGPRAATRANPAGLTHRELEVLALVAEGLRNARIAERLVVSEKTVDHHVSAILRKLDVGTRSEAAAKAARLGLLPPA